MDMKQKRRKFSSDFKARVAIETIKEQQTLSALSKRFGLHPNQISKWKKEFLDNADKAFEVKDSTHSEKQTERLYAKIGKLEVERDFLKKNLWKTEQ